MNPGMIWWRRLGSSLRLIESISEAFEDCRSTVLKVPASLPWRADFDDAVNNQCAPFAANKALERRRWEENAEPGEYLLREFCSEAERAAYYPAMSYAQYLAEQDDISLNSYYIWVEGIHSKADLVKWADFVSQYTAYAAQPAQGAVFILEYDGPDVEPAGVNKVTYAVKNHDCRVFALEAAEDLANSALRTFQAELALCVSGGDPELCCELLTAGEKFLKNPAQTAEAVIGGGCASDGTPFAPLDEDRLASRAWEATVIHLFPVLERCRMDLIRRNADALNRKLPINNSNGERVDNVFDLELSGLFFIGNHDHAVFSGSDFGNLQLCRDARNLLAHNKIPSYSEIKTLLNLFPTQT